MYIVSRDLGEETEWEKAGQVSVAEHWVPYPESGQSASLDRLERNSSVPAADTAEAGKGSAP